MTPANDQGPGEGAFIAEPARRGGLWKWGLAGVASLALHGALAYAFWGHEPPAPPSLMEGAQGVTLAIEGDPFDATAAGEETATADPVDPVRPETIEEAVQPAETQTAEPVEPIEETPPDEVVAALPEEAPQVVPEEPDVVAPVAPETPETIVSAAPPEAVEAEPEIAETVPETVPVPTVRPRPPEPEPPQRRVAERPREEPRRERAEPRVQRGNQGEQQANARAGARQGSAGTSASQGARGRQGSGTASLSNYRGQLVGRIERAKRSVRVSRGGTAQVSFSISSTGTLTGVSLAGSSGDPRLDREAIATVRRAAPYPPVPAGLSTPFSAVVPIRFR